MKKKLRNNLWWLNKVIKILKTIVTAGVVC